MASAVAAEKEELCLRAAGKSPAAQFQDVRRLNYHHRMTDTPLVQLADWLVPGSLTGLLLVRVMLLDEDVRSVQIAYRDYSNLRDSILSGGRQRPLTNRLPELFHHAKIFVCAVRRVARLVESLVTEPALSPVARKAIKLAWRKKRALLTSYTGPRDAIEHIDEQLPGRTNWVMMNLVDDELRVTEDPKHRAPVAESTVAAVLSLREEILAALRPTGAKP